MHHGKITSTIIFRYVLFQVPEFILFVAALLLAERWIEIPAHFFWGFLAFLILKDAIIFPFVWRAYDNRDAKRIRQLIGRKGTVVKPLNPAGFVRVKGELWKAETSSRAVAIEVGEDIVVKEAIGLRLIVDRIDVRDES